MEQDTAARNDALREVAEALRANLTRVVVDVDEAVEQVLVAVFCGGNILLEDVPGVGKTTLAKALARSVNARFSRIQFTPDLLPADILGGSIYSPQTGDFTFREGPVFANFVLADEINRASPRTQAALLEAMSEGQATVEGVRRPLDPPFTVLATQNPVEFHGTYPLPEAQLDRFTLRVAMGYPHEQQELQILYAQQTVNPLETIEAVTDTATLRRIQAAVKTVGVEDSVGAYLVRLIRATREDGRVRLGASPRASLMLFRASQALAFLRGRDYVTPDDIKDLAVPVLAHRLMVDTRARYAGAEKAAIVEDLLGKIPLPV